MQFLAVTVREDSAFVADSIQLMASQIRAIRWCLVNISLSRCLNELSNATAAERTLVADPDSPPLLYIRSGELLAFFLLRIYRDSSASSISFQYNGTIVNVTGFPALALSLCAEQNLTAPQRPINLLSMLRAHYLLGNTTATDSLARVIKDQWRNTTSYVVQSVLDEVDTYLNKVSSGARRLCNTWILLSMLMALIIVSK